MLTILENLGRKEGRTHKVRYRGGAVHPLFEYDLNSKNYDQNMTIFDPKLFPFTKELNGCTKNA